MPCHQVALCFLIILLLQFQESSAFLENEPHLTQETTWDRSAGCSSWSFNFQKCLKEDVTAEVPLPLTEEGAPPAEMSFSPHPHIQSTTAGKDVVLKVHASLNATDTALHFSSPCPPTVINGCQYRRAPLVSQTPTSIIKNP